jgi:hypothetical protein
MPFLVQIILPVYDNERRPFSPVEYVRIRRELTERFGGMTAYMRAPAEGFWEDADGQTHRDDVVIVEVMTDMLDRDWWSEYGRQLAQRFAQEEMAMRALAFESLSVSGGTSAASGAPD